LHGPAFASLVLSSSFSFALSKNALHPSVFTSAQFLIGSHVPQFIDDSSLALSSSSSLFPNSAVISLLLSLVNASRRANRRALKAAEAAASCCGTVEEMPGLLSRVSGLRLQEGQARRAEKVAGKLLTAIAIDSLVNERVLEVASMETLQATNKTIIKTT